MVRQELGGVNAKQIGLGVTTGATSVSITNGGAAETTGLPFDLRLSDKNSTSFLWLVMVQTDILQEPEIFM